MSVRCVPVKATLSARGDDGLTATMWAHIEGCESCRADLADDQLIRSDLRGLASVSYTAPPETVPRVMASIGPWAVPDVETGASPTVKVIAAAAVATAAATAAASTVVMLTRYRHRAA